MTRRRLDPERGSATVWVLALAGVLAAVGLAAVLVGAAVTARHRAGTAADLAALTAALAAVEGESVACGAAARMAADNGTELTSCAVHDGNVFDITVAAPVRLGPLGLFQADGRARAGPAGPD